ncbi:RdgB/HAM1 family non-canonical purine NTP pyrophosphatase [bacterium]|jgi:XTP/dITP diphosphohydrolase|nr:RdgB/HAM1 family non-canonical purine NTP pyrophosphatase [bacterium]
MTHQIVLATNNANKCHEMTSLLSDLPVSVSPYKDIYPNPVTIIEDGLTFEENAIKKVTAFSLKANTILVADDSGLEVDILDGAPGIYSARYAGENASKEELCHKLLKELHHTGNRDAQFQCVIAIRFPDNAIQTTSGIIRGHISPDLVGDNGFGYDAVFIPEGDDRTFAQMSSQEKNALSHRHIALQQAKILIQDALI